MLAAAPSRCDVGCPRFPPIWREQVTLLAQAEAERTRLHAAATAVGLRQVAEAIEVEGGKQAMVQRLAERYVSELAEMVLLIVLVLALLKC